MAYARRHMPHAIAAGALGALLMSTGASLAATPAPAPGIVEPASPALQVRMMKRGTMKRSMTRRGGGRTISTKLGTKTR